MHPFKLVSALFLTSLTSYAADPSRKAPLVFCAPAAEIAAKAENCEDNDAFIEKGEDCLDKLDAEARAATATFEDLLSTEAASSQAAKLQSAGVDYSAASGSLSYLISLDELAIGELDGYASSLTLPEDADEPEINRGNEQKYAMSVSCYGETTKSIRSIQSDFRKRLKKLQDAKKIMDVNAAKSGSGAKKLNGGSAAAPVIHEGVGAGGVATPAGTAENTASDITGTKKEDPDAPKQP